MADPISCLHCGAVFAIQRGPRDAPESTSPRSCPFCGLDELRELGPEVREEPPPEPKREQHEPADAALTLASLLGSTMTSEPEKKGVAKPTAKDKKKGGRK